ncbi:MAG: hypothetical protein ACO34E_12595 [Limisphaerales bacterium]|jgi:hypothetical protein
MTEPERRWHLFCTIAGVRDSELHTALENAKDHFKMGKHPPEWVSETITAYYRACEFAQSRFDSAPTTTDLT